MLFYARSKRRMKPRPVLRTEASAVLQTPQIRCDIPDPGIDRQFDKYNYSKQTSTVLRYDLTRISH